MAPLIVLVPKAITARGFPAFQISHEISGDRIHYIARRRDPAEGAARPTLTRGR